LKHLDLSLVDEALAAYVQAVEARPQSGWVRAIREALGMTRAQLAARVGVAESTINTLERSEARGAISISSLEKLAAGLGGRLVYAIVPHEASSFSEVATKQAHAVARKKLGRVAHSMKLEDQSISPGHQRRQLEQIVESLMKGSRRNLWR
jgi:predicted DNA-binding mobile mystery protein A